MHLKKITLSGFRAFAETTTVDLDADCIILVGTNGQGKTSLLDGLVLGADWARWGESAKISRSCRSILKPAVRRSESNSF